MRPALAVMDCTQPRIATLATCNLDQWAMDFEGNLKRIISSIQQSKARGASYRASSSGSLCLRPSRP